MSRAEYDIISSPPEFVADVAYLLIYRNECDTAGEEKWRVSAYCTEGELIQDLIENEGPAFPALHMRLGLVGEVRE